MGSAEFDKHALEYDNNVRDIVPQYDEVRFILFDLVPFEKDSKITVLDIGIGTGTTAAEFLQRYPNAKLIGVDISSKMIEQSRQKLDQYKSRTELVQADMKTLQIGQVDMVYSILTLHHVPYEDKEALFRKVRTILQPGGVFILIDLVNGISDQLSKHYHKDKFHKEQGTTSSVIEYFDLLRKAGFKSIDVAWKNRRLACLIALKVD
jgi:tRNA (cmo5U34)-methyltransferase